MSQNPILAISIKTFFRERSLFNTLNSIEKYCSVPYRIYIADDGPINQKKETVYKKLEDKGHCILRLPYNVGASQGRVEIVKSLQTEKYLLRLDDDFAFEEKTDIQAMIDILKGDEEIGVVTDLERTIKEDIDKIRPRIEDKQGFLHLENGVLRIQYFPLKEFVYQTINNRRYAPIDYGRNFLLIKREVLSEICWDPGFPIHFEHLDFALQIFFSKWKFVFTPDSVHLHCEILNQGEALEYQKIRRNNKSSHLEARNYLLQKWELKSVQENRKLYRLLKESKKKIFAFLPEFLKEIIKKQKKAIN